MTTTNEMIFMTSTRRYDEKGYEMMGDEIMFKY